MKLRAPFSTIVAVLSGLVVLGGYFFPQFLGEVRVTMLRWAVVMTAFALLAGVYNLLSVHIRKMQREKNAYSGILLISFVVALGFVLVSGPTGPWALWMAQYVQVPLEASMFAVLAVVLAYASARLLYRRTNLLAVVFVVTTLVVLMGMAPLYLFPEVQWMQGARNLVTQVLAVGGARGILLGVALGVVATGLRVLMGADRPYEG